MKSIMCLALCAVLIGGLTTAAKATITGGDVTSESPVGAGGVFIKLTPPLGNPLPPPNSVGSDTFNLPNLYGFDEGQNIVLPAALSVDDLADGLGGGTGPGSLPAGTIVASHYVFFDPTTGTQEGFVDFDSDILAVISSTNLLAASDFLISTGVTYLNPVLRGLEGGDFVTITGLQRVSVNWSAGSPGDYIRVLTAISPGAMPEPATATLGLLAVAGLASRRRRTA